MSTALVGSRIRTRREALGLKQRDVASGAGISASYLNLIEHNHRGIAGKVLINLAKVLDIEVSALLEGSDREVQRRLQAAAAANADAKAEVARSQDFISRFPGWARLGAALQERTERLQRRIGDLGDRLAHDPFLAESLHEILSSVTAIHATSGILVEADGAKSLDPLQRRRFQANIHEESARLSHLSRALVTYFNVDTASEKPPATPLDEVEAFFAGNGYHFSELEAMADNGTSISKSVSNVLRLQSGRTLSADARRIATVVLSELAKDVRTLPLQRFLKAARHANFAPLPLSQRFGTSPARVMRRLAFLPKDDGTPQIGLIICDGSGAVLLRKPLAGFPLPRYGGACALWPLYQAITRPHVPLTTCLATSDDGLFMSNAYCEYIDQSAPASGVRSTMILRRVKTSTSERAAAIRVGQSCRICEIQTCPARREPSIHSDKS